MRINLSIAEIWKARDVLKSGDDIVAEVSDADVCWVCPSSDFVMINIDGAYVSSLNRGGIGVVLRNEERVVIDGLSSFVKFLQLSWLKLRL